MSITSSPMKPGPGLVAADASQAAELAEQQLQLGRVREAEALLQTALRRCPLTDVQLARRICDLLLEAEREQQTTPTHSREPSGATADAEADVADWAAGGLGPAGGSGAASSDAAGLLRQAEGELAAGEARRAEAALQQALAACPPEQRARRRRIELYLLLVQCKRQG